MKRFSTFTVPYDKASQGLEILSDAVLHPSIDPEELKKGRSRSL